MCFDTDDLSSHVTFAQPVLVLNACVHAKLQKRWSCKYLLPKIWISSVQC